MTKSPKSGNDMIAKNKATIENIGSNKNEPIAKKPNANNDFVNNTITPQKNIVINLEENSAFVKKLDKTLKKINGATYPGS